jgi:6-pyruvoyl-tetrahydropterin synthase
MMLKRVYECEAAHQLTAGVPEGHQCRRLHGHRYVVTVSIHSDINPETGMQLEYSEIDGVLLPVIDLVDHRCLNFLGHDVALSLPANTNDRFAISYERLAFEFKEPDLAAKVRKNPTVENLGQWLYAELNRRFDNARAVGFLAPHVARVEVQEDSRSTFVADSFK